MDQKYATDAAVEIFTGPPSSGKTRSLIHKIAEIAERQTGKEKILVLAPSAIAAESLRERIEAQPETARIDLTVTTPQTLALELLGDPRANNFTKRKARILTDMELSFYRENLRVMGKRGRRFVEMIKFLERGWSEMREDEPGWLVTLEEQQVEAFAKNRLSLMDAFHPDEVCAICARWLLANPEIHEELQIAHIIVDECQSMSRSSQILACKLAKKTLSIAWDPFGLLRGEEPHAYEAGLEELMQTNETASIHELKPLHAPEAIGEALANIIKSVPCEAGVSQSDLLCNEGSIQQGSVRILECNMLDDEIDQVRQIVCESLDSGINPEDIYIAAANDAWCLRIEQGLEKAGVPTTTILQRQIMSGDFRDFDKSQNAQLFAALSIVADPSDALAWRCWCGFGDYLACSTAFANLPKTNSAEELAEFLEHAGGHTTERFREGMKLIESTKSLHGLALMEGILEKLEFERKDNALASLIKQTSPDESLSALTTSLRSRTTTPSFKQNRVKISSIDRLLGLNPRVLILAGAANGLFFDKKMLDLTEATTEQQTKMLVQLARKLYAACGATRQSVICSTFSHASLEQHEMLRLDSIRVRVLEGRRVVDLSPSIVSALLRGEEPTKAH